MGSHFNLDQIQDIPNNQSDLVNLKFSMDIIQNNPFRVLGLYADTSEREIAKRVNNLLTHVEIGKVPTFITDIPCFSECIRTKESIEEARQKIELRERRLFYSFFWFSNADSIDDLVLGVLTEGNYEKAIHLWEKSIAKIIDYDDIILKNSEIDDTIINEMLIPMLMENYEIDNLLSDESAKQDLIDLLCPCAKEMRDQFADINGDDVYEFSQDAFYFDDNGEEIDLYIKIERDEYSKVISYLSNKKKSIPIKYFLHTKNLFILYLTLSASEQEIDVDYFYKGISLAGRLLNSDHSLKKYASNIAGKDFNFDSKKQAKNFVDEIIKSLGSNFASKINLATLKRIALSFDNFPDAARAEAIDKIIDTHILSVNNLISDTKNKRIEKPASANIYCHFLHNKSQDILLFLKDVLKSSSLKYQSIADSVAEEILDCSIQFYNKNIERDTDIDPGKEALDLALYADTIATGAPLKKRINDSIKFYRNWIKDKSIRDRRKIIEAHIKSIIDVVNELPDPDKAFPREMELAEMLQKECGQDLVSWNNILKSMFNISSDNRIKVPSINILENFNDNKNKWAEDQDGTFYKKIDNNKYILNNKNLESAYWTWSLNNINFSIIDNFTLECSMAKATGPNNNGNGIVWAYKSLGDDDYSYSTFRITGDGHYYYGTYRNSEWIDGFKWKVSKFLETKNETNTLRIQKHNEEIKFYINDNIVGEDYAEKYSIGSGIGFWVHCDTLMEINYIFFCNDSQADFENLQSFDLYMKFSSIVASSTLDLCIAYANRTGEMWKPLEMMKTIGMMDMLPDLKSRFDKNYEILQSNLRDSSMRSSNRSAQSGNRPVLLDPHHHVAPKGITSNHVVWAIIVLVIMIALCSPKSKKEQAYTPPATPSSSASAPAPAPPPAPAQAPAPPPAPVPYSLTETKPPISPGNILNSEQLFYCLSEKIRIKAMESVVNKNRASEISLFNEYIDDFNSRCAHAKYPQRIFSSVNGAVENNRAVVETEGRARILDFR